IWVAFCWIALLLCFCSKNSTPPTAPALYSNQDLIGSWLGTSYIPSSYPTVTIDSQAIRFSVFLVNGNLSVNDTNLTLAFAYPLYSINFNGSGAFKIEQGQFTSNFPGAVIYSGLMNETKDSISGSIIMIGFDPYSTSNNGTWSVTKLQ
ncbi:MAG: hypothetical protein WBM07_09490, partial [Chitinivibrionales bacterium]